MPYVVVFDTNILLAALLSVTGSPFHCVVLAKAGTVESVTCQEILDEFNEKLRLKFRFQPDRAQVACDEVRSFSRVVPITNTLKIVTSDPDDDKVLECAAVGGATHVITGDRRHLLPLKSYQDITIIGAADFVQLATLPAGDQSQAP